MARRKQIPRYAKKEGEKELIIISVNFDKKTFDGYYKDIRGVCFLLTNQSIEDYELYYDDTEIGEKYVLLGKEFVKIKIDNERKDDG